MSHNTCHRHRYCQGCEDEATVVLALVWTGVFLGLCLLAWFRFS